VSGLSGITAIEAAPYSSLFVKNDGTAWATGSNYVGQLGDGTTASTTTPVLVSGLSGITAIAVGGSHSLFLKNNGTAWATGLNEEGQLGDGTTVNKSIPVSVSGLVIAINSYQWKLNGSDIVGASDSTYTATAAGSYTVTVTNSNGCSFTSSAHVVTASPILSSFAPSNGNVGSSVVLTGSGFTGTTAVLFNGVSASFVVDNSNTITATVPAGATTGTISVTVNDVCTIVSSTPFTVNASTITLNLNVFVEGFYLGNGLMQAVLFDQNVVADSTACDYITVELRESLNPLIPAVSSITTILHTDGTAQIKFPATINGGNYFIVIKHRNTIETWSKNPVTFTSVTTFDFTH
jgi:hypothetical protein